VTAADVLTLGRAVAGLVVGLRPSFVILMLAIASDWIDGALARRRAPTAYGSRLDLEADSLLTLGSAIAAVRRGAAGMALVAPIARYFVPPLRRALPLARDEVRWDRITGTLQMALFAAALAPWPVARALRVLAGPIAAARCATVAAQVDLGIRARLNSPSTR